MNKDILKRVKKSIEDLALENKIDINSNSDSLNNIQVSLAKEDKHGHFTTNVAMPLSKAFKMPPMDLANKLAQKLEKDDFFKAIEVLKPGFINFFVAPIAMQDFLKFVAKNIDTYGQTNIGNSEKVNIEYVSANPTGPLHAGHGRGAVIGDILANLYEHFGYQVTREYYCNDLGVQITTLAQSLLIRYKEIAEGKKLEVPEGCYPGEYLIDVAQELYKENPNLLDIDEVEAIKFLKDYAPNFILDKMIKPTLKSLGVNQDIFSHEKIISTDDKYNEMLNILSKRDVVYLGTLPPPKGVDINDYKPRRQRLFRSSKYGDETDRALEKANGERTYFANDILYHFDKINRGFSILIDILGADHVGYAKRIRSSVLAMSDGKIDLNVALTNMINLTDNGKEVKMSKRAGTFVTLSDVIDMIGSDAFRFMMITKKSGVKLNLDIKKIKEHNANNPIFYINYAYARISSVLRNAHNLNIELDLNSDLSLLQNHIEHKIIRHISIFEDVLLYSTFNQDIHHLYSYIYNASSLFHSFWNMGMQDKNLRLVLEDNKALTNARLVLIYSLKEVIGKALNIIGIEPASEM